MEQQHELNAEDRPVAVVQPSQPTGATVKTPQDRRAMLRVKVKSLADEARMIRHEERRASRTTWLREELHRHRILVVRMHAREAHVAYGMIRGLGLGEFDPRAAYHPGKGGLHEAQWNRVRDMVKKYGPTDPSKRDAMAARCNATHHNAVLV